MGNSASCGGVGVDWSLDRSIRHLNHGSFGAVPELVLERQESLRRAMEADPVRWFSSISEKIAGARVEMAALLNVEPERLAFVFNASAGASAVFQSLAGSDPVNVHVTNHGYGAVTMGAERLAKRTGGRCTVSTIPLSADADDATAILVRDLERYRPHLLVIDQVTSATARELPADAVCRVARDMGVLTLVDGAHAPGVLPDPICREADFWIGNLHKFVCAPRGAAVLVANPAADLFPVVDSWGAQMPYPERFDHTGTMDTTPWLVAPYAWRLIDEAYGWAYLREHAVVLLDDAVNLVADALRPTVPDPVPLVGQPVGPMRLLRLPGDLGVTRIDADALRVPFGEATGVSLAFTSFEGDGYMRLSAHAYNTLEDYQHLARVGIPFLHQLAEEASRGNR